MQNQLFYAYFTAIEITTILLHTMIGLLLAYHGGNEDAEKYPIIFEDSFDENEIYDLLRKNRKRIGEIIEREVAEAVSGGELSRPDDQAGSMADHFH